MNVWGAILAKTFFTKHRILSRASNVAFSFPVSAVYSWNAWDQEPPFWPKKKTVCIFWLGLSYGRLSKNEINAYDLHKTLYARWTYEVRYLPKLSSQNTEFCHERGMSRSLSQFPLSTYGTPETMSPRFGQKKNGLHFLTGAFLRKLE